MKKSVLLVFLILIAGLVLIAGCSQTVPQNNGDKATVTTAPPPVQGSVGKITPADLTVMVKEAVAYAKENGKERAIAAFNDPNGSFVKNGIYIFAEDYDGTALAEPFEHGIVGTNIRNMTDRYGSHWSGTLKRLPGTESGTSATITRIPRITTSSCPSSRSLRMWTAHTTSVPVPMRDPGWSTRQPGSARRKRCIRWPISRAS